MSKLMYRSVAEIDLGSCIKCGKCSFVCPEGIIAWTSRSVPRINQKLCTACSLCVAACPVGAVRIVRKASILPLTVLAVFLVILAVSTYLIIIAGQGSPGAPATPIENPVGWAGKYTIERPYASETVPGYVSEYTYSRGYEPSEKSGG